MPNGGSWQESKSFLSFASRRNYTRSPYDIEQGKGIKPMKSLTEHLWFEVPDRRGFVNITGTVEGLVKKSGVQDGLCLVNAMHITAITYATTQKQQ